MIRTLAAALATTTCIVALATPAAAQTREFNIPAGSLRAALDTYARQSGRQVIYGGDVRSVRSPGVRGARTADDALNAILAGTGFVVKEDRSGALAIVKGGNALSAGDAASTRETGGRNDPAEGESANQIVVTGTRIRGVAPDTVPVTTYDRQAIDRSGAGNTAEFMRTVPENLSSTASAPAATMGFSNTQYTENQFSGAGVNLQGLGQGSTLVLLNGHRLAPAGGSGSFTDISTIPLAAVQRVEVLTGGASALYGADAVGGVVNFVLRRDFEGSQTAARYAGTGDGGAAERSVSQLLGVSWQTGNVMGAYEWRAQDALNASQRDFIPPIRYQPFEILPETEQHSVFLAGRQDVTDWLSMSVDFLHSDRDFSIDGASPTGLFTSRATGNTKALAANLTFDARLGDSWRALVSGQFARNEQSFRSDNGPFGITGLQTQTKILSADATADGPLFALVGGEVRAALGASIRREEFESQAGFGIGRRQVASLFGELRVPLISRDMGVTLARRLELSLAARLDDYSDTGSSFNPRLGLLWSPAAGLNLRASYGTSFQAPSLSNIYGDRAALLLRLPHWSIRSSPRPRANCSTRARTNARACCRPRCRSSGSIATQRWLRLGPPHLIGIHMRELALDRIGVPLARFVQQRGRHSPEPVGGHLVRGIAEPPETLVHGVLRHRLPWLSHAWKHVLPMPGDLPQLLDHPQHLARQRHPMRTAHLHPCRGDRPDSRLHIDVAPFGLPEFAGAQKDMR